MHIGESLKRSRSYRGMTQAALAESIGKTRSLISFFERTGNNDSLLKWIEQQHKEIQYFKETINKQWSLIENLSKGKKTPPSDKKR